MPYVRSVALLAGAALTGALLAAGPAGPAAAEPRPEPRPAEPRAAAPARPEWVGTYQRVARDVVQPDGTLRDVYDDRLVVGDRSYRLTLPKGTRLRGGTPVRVRGRLSRSGGVEADEATPVGAAAQYPTTGTTRVLVILVHWLRPDGITVEHARQQVFTDDHGWYGEASYGQLGLTGDVSGWHQILPPAPGGCYADHMTIMTRAKDAARTAGYDATRYGRTIVYFPKCEGDSSAFAGWAYQPGDTVWLNGYFDRRVSVHEQGHNYGLPHAHTLDCRHLLVQRVTLSDTCTASEYGDPYDAMGGSGLVGHFSAAQKERVGWLAARKRVVTSTAASFTLRPYEHRTAAPVAAVVAANVRRKYWLEYRRPIGYDAMLPTGATEGVLVHMTDPNVTGGGGPFLLDMSPGNYWEDVVIPPSGVWTSPEGVRIAVGQQTVDGIAVTVTGGAEQPAPPTEPRNLVATSGDESVRLTWDAPESTGGATVDSYVVVRTPGDVSTTVDGTARSLTVNGLANDTPYEFAVAARNAIGTGPAAAAAATPAVKQPDVAVTAPAPGARVGGPVTLSATATPNAVSQAPVTHVTFEVDGAVVARDDTAPYSVTHDFGTLPDGPHTVTATAYDANTRFRTSVPVEVEVTTPRPAVTLTAPAPGAAVESARRYPLTASTTPAPDTGAAVLSVRYELADGTVIGLGGRAAPHAAEWDTTGLRGEYTVVARAFDETGAEGVSAPVRVVVRDTLPTVALTAPAAGARVAGVVTLAADAAPGPDAGAPVDRVELLVGGELVGTARTAPYRVEWDSRAVAGERVVTARVVDTNGRAAVSAPRTVVVTNPLPSVTVTGPAAAATVGGPVTLSAAAEPHPDGAPLARVTFTVDGSVDAGTVAAPGPYTTTWRPGTAHGPHTVVATAYDTAGRSARSAPVTFTVVPPAPSVTLTSPTAGATVRSGLTMLAAVTAPDPGTGSPVRSVDFLVDGTLVGSDTDPSDGFGVAIPLARGRYVVTSRAHDADGFTGDAAPVAVTIADPPGAPTAVTATPGPDGTATVSWTAPASDGGSPLSGYAVHVSDGTERAATSSPFTVRALANGRAYSFTVVARNAAALGPPSAPTARVTPGTRTALTVAVSEPRVAYGRRVTVRGTLTGGGAPLAARTVRLLSCAPGSATACAVVATGTTSASGAVALTYAPPRHRDLRLRYVASGDRYLATTSPARRVLVTAVVSSALSRTAVAPGGAVTVSGRVTPAHAGRTVYLQRLTGSGWQPVASRAQSDTGYVAWVLRPATAGTYRYRLYFPGDADHGAGYSPSRTLTVTG